MYIYVCSVEHVETLLHSMLRTYLIHVYLLVVVGLQHAHHELLDVLELVGGVLHTSHNTLTHSLTHTLPPSLTQSIIRIYTRCTL